MSLHWRLLKQILPALLILAGMLYFAGSTTSRTLTEQVENAHARQVLSRTVLLIQREQKALEYVVRDWAWWDDLYNHAMHPDAEFTKNNLSSASLLNIGIDVFMITDAGGNIINALDTQHADHAAYAQQARATMPHLPALTQTAIVKYMSADLAKRGKDLTVRHELTRINGRMLLTAATVILNSRFGGQPAGVMLMGKYFDDDFMRTLRQLSGSEVQVIALNEARALGLDAGRHSIINPHDEQRVLGVAYLNDSAGQPLAALRLDIPRIATNEMHWINQSFLLSLIVLFMTMFAILFGLINRLVLRRIKRFDETINRIRHTQNMLGYRLHPEYNDELGHLGITLNEMLDTMAHDHQKLAHSAHHDDLTGLANRRLIMDRFEQAVHQSDRHFMRHAIISMDIDGLKQVNDTLGHAAGDALLRETANRIRYCVRRSDTAARIGGDEFCVLLYNVEDQRAAIAVAEKILQALRHPLLISEHPVHISASLGVVMYPEHGNQIEVLLKLADEMMYESKRSGKNSMRVADLPITPPASSTRSIN